MSMTEPLAPANPAELAEAVRSFPRVLAVGARTKPRLSETNGEPCKCSLISTQNLRGIVEYQPEEFTFTALAGTPVKEIAAALMERGQYLPFDPMWSEAGATLGGTISAGLSGPGRFRYGGVRDFILGVRFVDGQGRLLRMGGKVVKNCAGFDLPKFFVGSVGRFGILAEATFKVFPSPPARLTLSLPVAGIEAAVKLFTEAANSRWEPEALDLPADGQAVCMRFSGPAAALESVAKEICARWAGTVLSAEQAETVWSGLREFRWIHNDGILVKIPLTPTGVAALAAAVGSLADARLHASAGGNVAYLSLPSGTATAVLNDKLSGLGLSGLCLRGAAPLWLGVRHHTAITAAVKGALDPQNRFPALDD